MNKRIGIYGGSFNPIHNGHVAIASELLATGFVDEILFVVSPHNPLKKQDDLWPDELRLSLAEKALAPYPKMNVSDVETRLPKPSYMWATLQELSRQNPEDQIILLIGADNWLCFDRWFRHDDILKNYEVGIYPRPHCEIDAASIPSNVHYLPTGLYDISSTDIRAGIAEGRDISSLVPFDVNILSGFTSRF